MPAKRKSHSQLQYNWRKYWASYIQWTENITWLNNISLSHRPWIISLTIFLVFLTLLSLYPKPQKELVTDQVTKKEVSLVESNLSLPEQKPLIQPQINNTNEEWQQLQLQPGQSIAQLFRDNNLPVNDAFALANAEGDNSQLNNLPPGQIIRVKQAKNGTIVAVDINLSNQEQIYFVRQPDGTFIML